MKAIPLTKNGQQVHGAVFDMDGLLLDTERMCMRAYQQAACEVGVEFEDSIYHTMVGHRADKSHAILRRALGPNMPIKEILNGARRLYYQQIEEDGIPLKTGVVEILNHFDQLGIPMAVATSTFYDLACSKLSLVKIHHFFKDVISGDRVSHGKPHPEIYLTACKAIGHSPEDCIAFEDSKAGLNAAHDAGLTTVIIPDIKPVCDEMQQYADIRFESLNDYLKNLEEN